MRDDTQFDEFVRRHGAGYRANAEPPADEMWRGIEADVQAAIHPSSRFSRRPVWLAVGAAIAATLVIGVAIGRWSAMPRAAVRVDVATAPMTRADSARLAAHLHAATADYLEDAQVFLTETRADLRAGRQTSASAADRASRSRELLARTRLLLASPEAQSPAVNRLLEDLELLLAEIAALPDSGHSVDAALLEETLRRDDIIPRIRTTLPASAGT